MQSLGLNWKGPDDTATVESPHSQDEFDRIKDEIKVKRFKTEQQKGKQLRNLISSGQNDIDEDREDLGSILTFGTD
jgi:hypothetical protein